MKQTIFAITLCLVATSGVPASNADSSRDSEKYAKKVKMLIAKEHKKHKTNPKDDFERMHDLCGKSRGWTKGCRFWKGKGGKNKYMFQILPSGKIYGVPGMFQR